MAASAVLTSRVETLGSSVFVLTHFNYAASGDTVAVPLGCVSAAVLVGESSTTSPTSYTITQGAGSNDTVTVTGGTVGGTRFLVSRHTGGPGSSR